MTRIVLRLLNAPALLLIALLGIALQTSLFTSWPLNYLQPDTVLILVVWCALHRGFMEGGVLTLIMADAAEVHTAAPQGVFLVTYMLVFLGVRGAAKILVLPRYSSVILLTLAASVFWKLSGLGLLHLLGASANQWRHTLEFVFPGAVVEGVLAIPGYRWLAKFDWATFKSPRAEQALEGELSLDQEFDQELKSEFGDRAG